MCNINNEEVFVDKIVVNSIKNIPKVEDGWLLEADSKRMITWSKNQVEELF